MENVEMKTVSPIGGLRLLHKANIMSVVAVSLTVIASIIMLGSAVLGLGLASEGNAMADGFILAAGVGGLIALVSVIFLLVAGIMEIVALVKASPAHAGYKTALLWVAAGLVFSLIIALFTLSPSAKTILGVVPSVLSLLKVFFVISATTALLSAKGDTEVTAKGIAVRNIYVVCTAIMVVATLVSLVPALAAAIGVVTLVVSIVQLVALFKYIGFLGNSVKAFEKLGA